MDCTICVKETSPATGCLTRGRSSNRSGSSRSERFRRVIGGRKKLGAHECLGRRLVGLGTRVRCRARAAHVKRTPMCANSRFGRARRRLRMSLSGLWLYHGLRGGGAAPEPEAVVGATPLFRCLPWHLRRLGCALHPNLRGGRSGPAIPCGKAIGQPRRTHVRSQEDVCCDQRHRGTASPWRGRWDQPPSVAPQVIIRKRRDSATLRARRRG